MTPAADAPFDAHAALERLLAATGIDPGAAHVRLTGTEEGPLASPHRLASAMGIAIAAQAACVAEVWRARTGRLQAFGVDLQAAADALNPAEHLRQNGYPVTIRFAYDDPGNGFFRARDGRWIYMSHLSPRLRDGLLEVLDAANTKPALARAIAARDAVALESECQSRGLPLVMVRSADEWRAHPHGRGLAARPPVTIERIADGEPMPFGPASRPLAGLRVLENTHVLAGPGVGRTLAEQGADALRITPPRATDTINLMIDTGFGKRSAFLDLDTSRDIDRYRALASDADVIVQSLRPEALERRGLGLATLAAASRGLVYVSISLYGEGPWAKHVGYDPLAQSATGIAVREGGESAPRVVPSTLLADYLTAALGAFGATAALVRRARDGGSYHVRVSLAATCMWVQSLGYREVFHAVGRSAPPHVARMASPFGELEYLTPVAQFAETPAFWARPPQPLGASSAVWLAR